ncbi:UNVERIFIED_CONTAM: hypothetical protein Slati_2718600 [Sesamum latifolium]|uniref:Reverse transcriptase domain-containing protein n=1 Tax=Sesamum latifolium TaxID=2727402 RepID=A0AAW2VWY7_9LAMI
MCSDSTAGPDGFSAHFYQSCWDIIGKDLHDAVSDFFLGASPPKNFTTTTIVLIPKTEAPATWKDFRPISLCNVTGKILSKIVNNQMASLLPKIISPLQSGFVQGRMISDNILLAQELSHCLGKNGSLSNKLFKLDMEKLMTESTGHSSIIGLAEWAFQCTGLTRSKSSLKSASQRNACREALIAFSNSIHE